MEIKELIESGTLELYVLGSLSQREALYVEDILAQYPAVQNEIEAIEGALLQLGTEDASLPPHIWQNILNSIEGVRKLPKKKDGLHWLPLSGWAAAVLCLVGIFWMFKQQNNLSEMLQNAQNEKGVIEDTLENMTQEYTTTSELLAVIRSKEYQSINLPGNQEVAPDAFARVYFNATEKIAYIDANDLPEAPEGKVYQVWSLIMDPLTPRSMGLLDDDTTQQKIFKLENVPNPEAFGITLEPEGGSESPSLDQLYVLGTVSP